MSEAVPWRWRITSRWLGVPLLALWRLLDLLVPKCKNRWAFFDHPLKHGQFIENARAVHEQVKHDPNVHCHVFVRGGRLPMDIEQTAHSSVFMLDTLLGLWRLSRCGVLLLTNSTSLDMSLGWRDGSYAALVPVLRRRVVINLWHGIPLKRLFALANPEQRRHGDRDERRRRERGFYDGLIASSDIDALAMTAIFHPIPPANVWATGLPRNDFLRLPENALPASLRAEMAHLQQLMAGRRLVLYAPTYRDASVAEQRTYCFSADELMRLESLLARHDAVLGYRGHYLVNAPAALTASAMQNGGRLLDLGHARFQEIASLLRHSAVVVTDYSSVYIDALYLDLPVIGFAFDLDHYRQHQNGLLYDLDLAFPGPMTTTFDDFLSQLASVLAQPCFTPDHNYRTAQRLFFRHFDSHNTQRVVQRVKAAIAAREKQ